MLKNAYNPKLIEVGCDEAGRGCLAGPVVAAAVIWNPKKRQARINDSKKLSKKNRDELRIWIEQNALDWAVASVSHEEIDEINILNASFLAMHRALDQLKTRFHSILVDGNRFTSYQNFPHHCIIKGDSKFKSIAAASILAKTHRDEEMARLAKRFPNYAWEQNQGYPTKQHREQIKLHGRSSYHRKSFRLLPEQLG